ncbi:MAG: hypothetical protein C5B56_06940 [Proteobacteria bacterium]|nr:MAG: hypothetical protein C5B56_06940 [Pseudomonadota bacterium]
MSSWGLLAALMIFGATRMPGILYSAIDGEWAKWNAQSILHFGNPFDLSPYNMLAGMGSIYLPNLPWLNPGALALALPFGETTTSIISFLVYGAELAVSIVVLARAAGASWLIATIAAQFHLYVLFPPFSEVFHISEWYGASPVYAHLTAVLNFGTASLLHCGRAGRWRRNGALSAAILFLFVSGVMSAPFTFIFFMPPYLVIGGVLVAAQRPSRSELAWKVTALLICLLFFVGSGLIDYYLGTAATAARTPAAPIAWDRLSSPAAWLRLLRDHSLCDDARMLVCFNDRGVWLQLAGLVGACVTIVRGTGLLRAGAWAFVGYIAATHLYSYAYQAAWLGPISVLSNHFMIWSSLSFGSIFAAIGFYEPFRLAWPRSWQLPHHLNIRSGARIVLAISLIVIACGLLNRPFGDRYRWPQFFALAVAIGTIVLVVALIRKFAGPTQSSTPAAAFPLPRRYALLAVFPILAVIHLSMGVRYGSVPVHDPGLRELVRENLAIELGQPFRGYTATVWLDNEKQIVPYRQTPFLDTARYVFGRNYFGTHYGETFIETDLWRLNIPTFEEYGQWTSSQAQAFATRLLAAPGTIVLPTFLRGYTIDPDILGLLGVRYIITDADKIENATLVRSIAVPGALPVHLFELNTVNVATYSPLHLITAHTADAITDRIRENKDRLQQVAVISDDDVPPADTRARNVVMTVERDGFRLRADSSGPAHIVVPVQFSHCLRVVNGASARLARVNLFQTLVSFSGALDAKVEFRFGLFADNKCRREDAVDNKRLGF